MTTPKGGDYIAMYLGRVLVCGSIQYCHEAIGREVMQSLAEGVKIFNDKFEITPVPPPRSVK